jgi:hypothetical protein
MGRFWEYSGKDTFVIESARRFGMSWYEKILFVAWFSFCFTVMTGCMAWAGDCGSPDDCGAIPDNNSKAAAIGGALAGGALAAGSQKDKNGDPWYKKYLPKSIPLPGGFHLGTDKPRAGWGGETDLGHHVTVGAGVEVSPTEGSDPSGPIINVDINAKVQVHGATEGPGVEVGGTLHTTVGIDTKDNPGFDGLSTSTHDQMQGIDLP